MPASCFREPKGNGFWPQVRLLSSIARFHGFLDMAQVQSHSESKALQEVVKIREIRDETRTIRTFVLDAEVPEAAPGQFVMLWLPGVDEKPMSIASPVPLSVSVNRVGPFSDALHRRRPGDVVGWRGPFGRSFSLVQGTSPLLIAGGCGAAPVLFLASVATQRDIRVTVALGGRSANDLLYYSQFRKMGVGLAVATEDGSEGHHGLVTELIPELCAKARGRAPVIYACGPELMLSAVHRFCRDNDVSGQLSLERYIKCGFGLCGQCALDGQLVCQDGPVFDAEQLDSSSDFGHFHLSATGRRLPIR